MTLQVIRREDHKNRSRLVEFKISSRQVPSLNTIMSLAGIEPRTGGSPWGWDWDSTVGTCTVVQPWMFRGRVDHALRMFSEKWHPGFRTGLEIKEGVEA